jgi:lipopolysaccharide/colanic/teichoic acid biosynthesis glycosyltransferase
MRVSAVEGFVLKRGVDIALAALLLILSLPILAVAAIAIKMDSEGPVLFRQARMGRRFRRFQIVKLRTMRICGSGPAYTLSEDPRITRTGRWLRRHKVDELPQLWNVLCGEMTLVGPRPVVPELALEYRQAYQRLLDVRPGLTDPATLKYCHEDEFLSLVPDPRRYYKTILVPDKLRISAAYMVRSNLWTDLGVLAWTAWALVPSSRLPRFIRARRAGQDNAAERPFFEPGPGAERQSVIE